MADVKRPLSMFGWFLSVVLTGGLVVLTFQYQSRLTDIADADAGEGEWIRNRATTKHSGSLYDAADVVIFGKVESQSRFSRTRRIGSDGQSMNGAEVAPMKVFKKDKDRERYLVISPSSYMPPGALDGDWEAQGRLLNGLEYLLFLKKRNDDFDAFDVLKLVLRRNEATMPAWNELEARGHLTPLRPMPAAAWTEHAVRTFGENRGVGWTVVQGN